MHRSVDEVGAVVEREAIDCGCAKGGALVLATNKAQLRRAHRVGRSVGADVVEVARPAVTDG